MGVDVNHSDDQNDFIIHNLVSYSRQFNDFEALDYVLSLDNLEIDKKILVYSQGAQLMTGLQYAIHCSNHIAAVKLIKNFADVREVEFRQISTEFTKVAQLLYVLGREFDLEKMMTDSDTQNYHVEYKRFKKWVADRKRTVLTLTETVALVVRRNSTKQQVMHLLRDFEIPQKTQDFLLLRNF